MVDTIRDRRLVAFKVADGICFVRCHIEGMGRVGRRLGEVVVLDGRAKRRSTHKGGRQQQGHTNSKDFESRSI